CDGGVSDGGYNLADDGSCPFSATSLSDTSAGLDPTGLQDNGGPTQTIALEAGSAAIGHVTSVADCTGNDQRGVPLPTPCDIGAMETPLLSVSPSTVAPGGEVVLTFSGFAPDASVALHLGTATGTVLGTFKMSPTGGLATGQETVKSTYEPQKYELYAVSGVDTAETTITVT
ncbi:MAG TPA: choice-of-anchor Q domain-containing protein, partial [Acidimicrobiales bacterium]|nr:choice-of-anchor Q domain-containing protein [Acidimicrobiales bacterium]